MSEFSSEMAKLCSGIIDSKMAMVENAIADLVAAGELPAYCQDDVDKKYFVFESGRTFVLRDEWTQSNDGYECRSIFEEVPPRHATFTVTL